MLWEQIRGAEVCQNMTVQNRCTECLVLSETLQGARILSVKTIASIKEPMTTMIQTGTLLALNTSEEKDGYHSHLKICLLMWRHN